MICLFWKCLIILAAPKLQWSWPEEFYWSSECESKNAIEFGVNWKWIKRENSYQKKFGFEREERYGANLKSHVWSGEVFFSPRWGVGQSQWPVLSLRLIENDYGLTADTGHNSFFLPNLGWVSWTCRQTQRQTQSWQIVLLLRLLVSQAVSL